MTILAYELSKGTQDYRTGTIDVDTKIMVEITEPTPVVLLEQVSFLHALETMIEYMRIQGITRMEIG